MTGGCCTGIGRRYIELGICRDRPVLRGRGGAWRGTLHVHYTRLVTYGTGCVQADLGGGYLFRGALFKRGGLRGFRFGWRVVAIREESP